MNTAKRKLRRHWAIVLDLAALAVVLGLSYQIRFDWDLPVREAQGMLAVWPFAVLVQYFVLWLFEVPRFAWTYISLREVGAIAKAIGVSLLLLVALRLAYPVFFETLPHRFYARVPFGVIAINAALSFLAIVGMRVLYRLRAERRKSGSLAPAQNVVRRTLLIGAGRAGVLAAREIESRPDLGIRILGFVDDDPGKLGARIMGYRVLGNTEQIEALCERMTVDQVLITMASASGRDLRRIILACKQAKLRTQIIPGFSELISGNVNLARLREVALEDLLRRKPVELEAERVAAFLKGKKVVVSGAGGSIGSELCRQICAFGPRTLILLERSENSLFAIHKELVESHPGIAYVPCLADCAHQGRVEAMMRTHRPDLVFHAAAHKHVPMLEWNACESIKNNILGTRTLADCAHASGVEAFVMVSTDKAVNPTSVMGASKRICEIYTQALAKRSRTRFCAVRFGNVLGSVGSVVPIFRQQIAAGGPVTVTHPEMKRYFMTIPEASQLILQAGAMGRGGEIFVLDMGEPVRILDLAQDLIRLSGYEPGEDIEIAFTGVRPGEKLFEELATDGEDVDRTTHEKILVMKDKPRELAEIGPQIERLCGLADRADSDEVKRAFRQIVPEYRSPEAPADEEPEAAETVAQAAG